MNSINHPDRQIEYCRGCGGSKQIGCIVCWDCFKYRTDITPFKPFMESGRGDYEEWLEYLEGSEILKQMIE